MYIVGIPANQLSTTQNKQCIHLCDFLDAINSLGGEGEDKTSTSTLAAVLTVFKSFICVTNSGILVLQIQMISQLKQEVISVCMKELWSTVESESSSTVDHNSFIQTEATSCFSYVIIDVICWQ